MSAAGDSELTAPPAVTSAASSELESRRPVAAQTPRPAATNAAADPTRHHERSAGVEFGGPSAEA